LDTLDEAGLAHTGSFRTFEESQRILFQEVAGVNIAFISATYGSNGMVLPRGYEFALNYISDDKLLSDIGLARLKGAQYVIVMLHWGVEYQPNPSREQLRLANVLLAGGADLILGHHPHVLQRGEAVYISALLGEAGADAASDAMASGKDARRFVMYSLGNFVSNQIGMERLCSIILKLRIGVDGPTGETFLKGTEFIPIYTQKRNRQGASHHTVWPLEVALELLAHEDHPFGAEDRAAIPRAWDHVLNSQPALELLTLKGTPLWQELTIDTVIGSAADAIYDSDVEITEMGEGGSL